MVIANAIRAPTNSIILIFVPKWWCSSDQLLQDKLDPPKLLIALQSLCCDCGVPAFFANAMGLPRCWKMAFLLVWEALSIITHRNSMVLADHPKTSAQWAGQHIHCQVSPWSEEEVIWVWEFYFKYFGCLHCLNMYLMCTRPSMALWWLVKRCNVYGRIQPISDTWYSVALWWLNNCG